MALAKKCPKIDISVVDIDKERISNNKDINKIPVFEPGLSEIISETRDLFSTDISHHISNADTRIFISVNTPSRSRPDFQNHNSCRK